MKTVRQLAVFVLYFCLKYGILAIMEVIKKALFWDTDSAQIDKDKNAGFVIGRVLQFGDEAEWQWLKSQYDMETIKRYAANPKKLDKKSFNFWKLILNLS